MYFSRVPSLQYQRIKNMLFYCFLASMKRTMLGWFSFLRRFIQSNPLCSIFCLICIYLMANNMFLSPASGAQPPRYTVAIPPCPRISSSSRWQMSITVVAFIFRALDGFFGFDSLLYFFYITLLTKLWLIYLIVWMNKYLVYATIGIALTSLALMVGLAMPTAQNIQVQVVYPASKLKVQSLYIRGDGCGLSWSKGIIMSIKGTNIWSYALSCPLDTPVQIKILENDTNWMMGKNFELIIYSGSPPKTFYVYPSFNPSINSVVDTQAFQSRILNNSRKCSIYYPPSYHDNIYKTYPVLLMHDGQNLFQDSKSAFGAWKIQNTLNSLISAGNMEEIVVVGIWNTNNRNNQYTYSYDASQKFGGKGDAYLNFIEEELMPNINKLLDYRIPGKWNIGGSSLGGLISCYAIHTRPTVYEKAICMSSSFWWNNQDFPKTVLAKWANETVYIDSGDSGPSQDSMQDTIKVRDRYLSLGQMMNDQLFYYLDKGGQHNQNSWGKRFHVPLEKLFG